MSRTITYMPDESASSGWRDALSIGLVGVGLAFLLALLSYEARDIPTWVFLHPVDLPNDPAHNLLGRMGAIGAHLALFLFGAAAYLIPVCLVWTGVYGLVSRSSPTIRAWMGVVIAVLSGAAFLQVQQLVANPGNYEYQWFGLGGGIGHLLGEKFLLRFLGVAGSAILLLVAYVCAMAMMTGMEIHRLGLLTIDGIKWVGKTAYSSIKTLSNWRPWSRNEEPLDYREEPQARSVVPKEKRPRKKKEPAPVETMEEPLPIPKSQLDLPFDEMVEPKIIDASAPKIASKKNRPTLEEHLSKRQEENRRSVDAAPKGSLSQLFKDYRLPGLDLMDQPDPANHAPANHRELIDTQQNIIRTLKTFGIVVRSGDITRGPAITRFEIYPEDGLRVNRITALEADIARATKAERINILAPIPGKDTVGIEIANSKRVAVPLRELLEDEAFQTTTARIPVALGKDVYGHTIIADLASMPHLLVAGATGSGKSVCINTIIACLIYRFAPDELRFIMIDPKVVEMQNYNKLPHMALPVVTDPKKVVLALRWVVKEMERRYGMFAKLGVRNFEGFNKKQAIAAAERAEAARLSGIQADLDDAEGEEVNEPAPSRARGRAAATGGVGSILLEEAPAVVGEDEGNEVEANERLEVLLDDEGTWSDALPPKRGPREAPEEALPDRIPYIVVIIDELADLMQTAPADVEGAIARITQMARAAGIHMIVATQTPRADVITGVIKANIPSRIAFQVASALDSRVILDQKGAEKLVGKGDMQYLPPGSAKLLRAQGAFVGDEEIQRIIDSCSIQGSPVFDINIEESESDDEDGMDEDVSSEDEGLLERVLDVLRQEGKASTSLIQRRLRLGYTRAARLMDILEQRGIIGPGEGARPREILVNLGGDYGLDDDD
jgi:DNA segregation ATPase FtsK/SpoIIIE, S-DNA-T family